MAVRFVVIGGGPAGVQAATHAVRLGASVTLIEDNIVGGAANLWDCIPSKAMIATGGALSFAARLGSMGVDAEPAEVDLDALRERIHGITDQMNRAMVELLESQGVRILHGLGRMKGPHE